MGLLAAILRALVRRPGRTAIGAGVVVAGGAGALAAGRLLAGRLLATERTPRPMRVRVRAVDGNRVTLSRGRDTARDGTYGLVWDGGNAVVGEVVARDRRTVTRRLVPAAGASVPPPRGRARVDDKPVLGDPESALGLAFRDVRVPGELGPMPAWMVAGDPRRTVWLLAVHGRDGTREDFLRLMGVPARLGVTTLVLTYRNDPGAPASPDGRYHLGQTEWRDLEAAVVWARDHGATGVVAFGASMGGTIVGQFLHHSAVADLVRGVVLDSPVLDWRVTVGRLVTRVRLPRRVARVAERAIATTGRIDLAGLDLLARADDLTVPVLLVQGTDDSLTPVEGADRLAERRADLVTYLRVDGAEHVQAWNVAPAAYEAALAAFLDRVAPATP